ncbi:MAG: calcium/sodium antiporter [Symploca sp. SIO1B1]|nr:calcium/sodium antiporter [Symploca sp. SIO2D2]NER50662.1 calcium/sodium antiporter [Symploca sp. SIO1A3]NER98156.1 calcium/sodium antiporter [Symploca sp. SIO1B1]
MPELITPCVIFVVSLFILVKASDFFTDAAEKVGLFIGLSPFIIGVTIVSIGTSLPELISSILAVLQNSSEIVVSNVIGSNIANIFLIIGTASIMSTNSLSITYDLVSVDLPLFVGSAFLLALIIGDENFSTGEAWLLILGYLMYLFYTIKGSEENEQEANEEPSSTRVNQSSGFLFRQIIIIIVSAIFLYFGANYTIDSLIKISEILNIGKEIIAVSAVALGTSLPELIVTISAGLKGQAEIAVGNVIGSNIFNTFMVTGVSGLIGNLVIPKAILGNGLTTMVAGTILLFFATQDKKLTQWEGWLFFIFYGWFIGTTFNLL